MKKGKKYLEAKSKVEKDRSYTVKEGIELLQQTIIAKFDETVEVSVKLGIDPRHADQQVRSALVLPHGLGKEIIVAVFAKGDKAEEAKEAGADFVGAEELVEKVSKENWLDFDVAIATPDVMGLVGKLGKILGPRGLMPSPKVGSVTFDLEKAVKEAKGGRIEIRNDKGGVIHAPLGKVSFGTDKIRENFLVFMEALDKMKPTSSKGIYVRKVVIASTMGPGIKIDTSDIRDSLKGFEIAA